MPQPCDACDTEVGELSACLALEAAAAEPAQRNPHQGPAAVRARKAAIGGCFHWHCPLIDARVQLCAIRDVKSNTKRGAMACRARGVPSVGSGERSGE